MSFNIPFIFFGNQEAPFHTNAVDGSKFASSGVQSIETQQDGKILVGGSFENYGGISGRNKLVRLNPSGELDTIFCNNAVDSSKFTSTIYTLLVQSDGKILVGGNFTNYGGITGRNGLIRLNSDGSVDNSFCSKVKFSNTAAVMSLEVQPDGSILVAGSFVYVITNLVKSYSYLIKLTSDGSVDEAFCDIVVGNTVGSSNKFNNGIHGMYVHSDGKIYIGGLFTDYGGTSGRNRLVRLNSDGTLDSAFCSKAVDGNRFNSSNVYSIVVQEDGKILVAGGFINYYSYSRLIRLNVDGSLDEAFCVNASVSSNNKFNNSVSTLFIQSDNKIVVGGYFTDYNGTSASMNSLIRLNTDGTSDTPFNLNASNWDKFNGYVLCLKYMLDGKILVGGTFTYYSKSGRDRLIRLNSDGTIPLL